MHAVNALARSACATLVLVAAWVTPAYADPAANILQEVQAGAVPNATVQVSVPAAATATDVAALDANPGAATPSITPENSLSPDPVHPLAVVSARYGSLSAPPLPGVLPVPGLGDVPL